MLVKPEYLPLSFETVAVCFSTRGAHLGKSQCAPEFEMHVGRSASSVVLSELLVCVRKVTYIVETGTGDFFHAGYRVDRRYLGVSWMPPVPDLATSGHSCEEPT